MLQILETLPKITTKRTFQLLNSNISLENHDLVFLFFLHVLKIYYCLHKKHTSQMEDPLEVNVGVLKFLVPIIRLSMTADSKIVYNHIINALM